jgi:hypothetical protein
MSIPMVLLSSQRPRSLRVPIPASRYSRLSRVEWTIEVGHTFSGGVAFKDILIEPIASPRKAAVKITAYNPLSETLKRAVFLVTELDDHGHALGQWQMVWTQPIGPQQRVEFVSFIGIDAGKSVPRWEVIGVGAVGPGS